MAFASPWLKEQEADQKEKLPNCYLKQNPKLTSLGPFPDKTLFYMFYNMPHDQLQIEAARELQKRKWAFSIHRNVWSKKQGAVIFNPGSWQEEEAARPDTKRL